MPTPSSPATDPASELALLTELEPVVAANIDRHLKAAKPWNPHDYVPWSRGRDFALLGGEDWRPEDSVLDPAVRASLVVNLLTEDNLPGYHGDFAGTLGRDGAWFEWTNRWTAEEARHSIALRDYLVVTRAIDPVDLEQRRMAHMVAGSGGSPGSVIQTLAYVTFQELATRVAHRNTGAATGCPVGEQLLARIALDENLHMIFYRNLMDAALDVAPDAAVCAIRDMVVGFTMPGRDQPDFARFSNLIANAGIFDLKLHHDKVLAPVLRHWRLADRTDFGPAGEAALAELDAFVTELDRRATLFTERRAQRQARMAARAA
ncbi:putative acyl-[acyl-carrier-protein] desaturase DesA1 [Streptomyces sp. RB5]|uniref:Putative acyl-[acyl-carrier-protein] desaturase DesA1 n=1 Tax=Streptomyces smaragdinus TaxID=2585196 RepID=A0A7K0CD86_9ACTN|nr:acyl-ACP desaturase [Streptomyces smaragdinus]MQY11303.1 putative acyl-[acyl-carrier-protein] desaturase DesA1 [Streptomyces smaragdinus]